MGWHDGRSPDAAKLAGPDAPDNHAAVEAQSPPPLRCQNCRAARHQWRASSFLQRTGHGDVRLYRVVCTCVVCQPDCATYRAFVETNPAPEPFALPDTHWAFRLLATAELVPELRPDNAPTLQLPVNAMYPNDTPFSFVGPRSGLRFPRSPAPADPPPDVALLRAVLNGLRRLDNRGGEPS